MSIEYIDFARQFPTAELRQAELHRHEFELTLADGTVYAHKGRFVFADRQVDVKTGAIRLAGLLPNPGNSLRPGLYARVRTAVRVQQGALLVPQRAIIDLQGSRLIAVVDGNDSVNVHAVKLGETVGADWIVHEGVKPGTRVIVEGVQKVRNGMKVNPKPYVQILH